MSAGYQAVLWNRYKKRYDMFLWVGMVVYLAAFIGLNAVLFPYQNADTILIRAFGTLAILMLHLILAIGPLCRLKPAFLPLLYNRRHFGVSFFLVASCHTILSVLWFHGGGNLHPLVSLFTSNAHYGSFVFFPFEALGAAAWVIFLFMAVTSHDFWLNFLSPVVWKTLHMLVYVAYGLLVLHIALGILQYENSPALYILLLAGIAILVSLHVAAAVRENKIDEDKVVVDEEGWEYVCRIGDIADNRAKIVLAGGERIAIFKYDGKLSAVHNVCKHQLGPLGEGKVVDDCITCPWHGYQYRTEDGCAPPPFTEKVHTYRLRLAADKIYVHPSALPEGTYVEPLRIDERPAVSPADIPAIHPAERSFANPADAKADAFFIGWSGTNERSLTQRAFRFGWLAAGGALALALVFTFSQHKISRFQQDYDHERILEGWLMNDPVPVLFTPEGKDADGNRVFTTVLLVDALKHGAQALVAVALQGRQSAYVKITGYGLDKQYISCGPAERSTPLCIGIGSGGVPRFPLLEVADGLHSIIPANHPVGDSPVAGGSAWAADTNKTMEVKGEIIDPKCYFGAMDPGEGKAHRSCAVRCISGGIMPCIKYTVNGLVHYAVLVDAAGGAMNQAALPYVGEPVSVRGRLRMIGNWEFLYTEGSIQL